MEVCEPVHDLHPVSQALQNPFAGIQQMGIAPI